MAGVFKSLDSSDVRITPFRAYKAFSGAGSYTTYKIEVSSTPTELGNDALDSNSSLYTANNVLKDSAWRSINHLFYQNYYDNTKASFGSYNFTYQPRLLSGYARVISLPQRYVGEGLAPNTLELVLNNITYTNDLYNNLIATSLDERWGSRPISASNVVFSLKPTRFAKYHQETINFTTDSSGSVDYATDQYPSSVEVQNCYVLNSDTYKRPTTLTLQPTSSIVIKPNAPEYNSSFNFTSRDFTITMIFDRTSVTGTCPLIEKYETSYTTAVDENGNVLSQVEKRIPYSLSSLADGRIAFRKTDGITTLTYTSSFVYSAGDVLALTRDATSNSYALTTTTDAEESFTDTFLVDGLDHRCANNSPIYIGSNERLTQSSGLIIGSVHFYDTILSQEQVQTVLSRTRYYNNPYATAGNVFPQHGLIVVTDNTVSTETTSTPSISIQYRGTTTIYENEVSCTISPGEFNFSNNPTLQKYNPITNQYELTDFATGSSFKPYITQIGLYDDLGRLLVAGKLSQPVQLPSKVDSTIIVKFDR